MKVSVKIVPKDRPNSDGEWLEVELRRMPRFWRDAVMLAEPLIPGTHFLVSYKGTES